MDNGTCLTIIMMEYSCIIGNWVITSKIDGDSVKMDDIVQMMTFSLSIWHTSYICLKCSNIMPHSHVANMLNISNMPNVWTRLFSTNVFCSWFLFEFWQLWFYSSIQRYNEIWCIYVVWNPNTGVKIHQSSDYFILRPV